MKKQVLFSLLLLVSVCGHAEIYNCGNGVFTDKACPDGKGKTVKVIGAGSRNDSNIDFKVELKTYPVHGWSYYAVNTAMHRAGPFQAFARWGVGFEYLPIQEGNLCSIGKLFIAIAGIITMPEWKEYEAVAQDERDQWDSMYSLLKIHEDGHVQHGKEFGILLREKLMGIGPKPCDQLKFIADQTKLALTINLQKRDADYDYRTNHGLQQFTPR